MASGKYGQIQPASKERTIRKKHICQLRILSKKLCPCAAFQVVCPNGRMSGSPCQGSLYFPLKHHPTKGYSPFMGQKSLKTAKTGHIGTPACGKLRARPQPSLPKPADSCPVTRNSPGGRLVALPRALPGLLRRMQPWGYPVGFALASQGVQRPELRRPFRHGGFLRPFYGVSTAVDKRPKLLRPRKLWAWRREMRVAKNWEAVHLGMGQKSTTTGPQVLVHASIYQDSLFGTKF